jgi:hypothetical protein
MRSVLLSAAFAAATAVNVTISNVIPRTDNTSQIMDAHDGKIIMKDGLYWWYAASYGMCKEPAGNSGCSGAAPGACGFQFNHNVSLFSSPDLKNWDNWGPVFQMAQSGIDGSILFCPKVLFNAQTKLFVLWFNWILGSSFADSYYSTWTSPNPNGPWTMVQKAVTTLAYADTGDFNLFQDDDGSAYIIYTSQISAPSNSHVMSVEKLTDDYTATLGKAGNSGFFGESFVEAPAFFKRNGIYYAVFGHCCCYCQSGSPVTAYTSTSPMGPYITTSVIDLPLPQSACKNKASKNAYLEYQYERISRAKALRVNAGDASAAEEQDNAAPASTCGLRGATDDAPLRDTAIAAQQTDIVQYYSSTGIEYMWIGDAWQSAPDSIKGHDFTVWSPMSFTSDGNITHMSFLANFTVDVAPPPTDA